jgi:APA family basic amino acid/polyamine antiporter
VGGTIGAGIFVSIGVGAVQAGPALCVSFVLAALACSVSGLCFCEMASRVPASGSSYSYTLAVMGRFPAFVIGSVLVLDSIISAAACARAWAAYVRIVLPFLPAKIFGDLALPGLEHIMSFSLLAGLVCAAVGIVLALGITETTKFNNVSTILNGLVLAIFILVGLPMTDGNNWSPFAPNGFEGIVRGAGRIFFAFLGFDVVNCLAEETASSDAKAMVPRAIVLTILITAAVYVLVSVSFVGLAPISGINLSSPLASAFEFRDQKFLGYLVGIGAVGNTLTSVLSNFLVQPRIIIRMASDGFLPPALAEIDENGVPRLALLVTVGASALTALFVDFETLADMVSVASLVSLSVVCVCSVLVRVRDVDDESPLSEDMKRFHLTLWVYVGSAVTLGLCLLYSGPLWLTLCATAAVTLALSAVCTQYLLLPKPATTAQLFLVPFSPLLPLLGVLVNIYILLGLPTLALLRAAIVFGLCALYYTLRIRPNEEPTEKQLSVRRISIVGKTYDSLETAVPPTPVTTD